MLIESRGGFFLAKNCSGGEITFLNRMPFRGKWLERDYKFRPNRRNLEYLTSEFEGEIIYDKTSLETMDSYRKADAEPTTYSGDEKFIFKRPPMAHQLEDIENSWNREYYALLHEQGTGKTKIVIDSACHLFRKELIDCLIVVAWPMGVHNNWIEYELEEDCSVPYKGIAWGSNYKTKKKSADLQNLIFDPFDGLKVMAYNIDAMRTPAGQAHILSLMKNNRCMFVIDQSACIKNHNAARTEFLIKKAKKFAPYRRILDGDPCSEGAEELFSQFYFLDPMIIGHETWTGFKQEFCIERALDARRSMIVGYRDKPRLYNLIAPHSSRRLSKECVDLPERIYNRWSYELSAKENKIYQELKAKDEAYFEDEALEMDSLLIKAMRLQQISSGIFPFIKGELEGKKVWDTKLISDYPSRLTALLKLIDQIEGKAIIFARFVEDIALLKKHIPNSVSYSGGDSQEDRKVNKKRFLEEESVRFLIGQQITVGIGHTFVNANNVIFYTNDFSLRMRTEAEKRCHRTGQKKNVQIWDICAKGGQDEKILGAFRRKRDVSSEILQDADHCFEG